MTPAGGQNIKWLLVTQGVYFLKKYDQLSESVVFSKKIEVFYRTNGPNWESHANEFLVFSNTKVNVTNALFSTI